MIQLSRLNGKEFIMNCDLIKFVEATPDTLVTLTTGEKFMVRESVQQVVDAVMKYKHQLFMGPPPHRVEPGYSSPEPDYNKLSEK